MEALLDFYLASGVDASLGENVVDWFQLSEVQAKARQQSPMAQVATPAMVPGQDAAQQAPQIPPQHQPTSQRGAVQAAPVGGAGPRVGTDHGAIPDQAVISMARELASSTGSLADLQACLEAFDGCNLKRTAKSLVFADGNPDARIMLIGEAPGRDEDLNGKPFVGRSGQLLDRMLKAIGLDRTQVYIANTVPWRPPGNRTPTPQETEICRPFIQRQIELVNPDVVVFLGAASAKTLLGVQDGIRKMRGRWMTYPVAGRQVAALATYHPAYLLRSPLEKRLSWRDFLSVKSKLSELG